jgi:hypothetical protein
MLESGRPAAGRYIKSQGSTHLEGRLGARPVPPCGSRGGPYPLPFTTTCVSLALAIPTRNPSPPGMWTSDR